MALTPQFSSLSVGAYLQAATEAAGPISFRQVRSWYSQRAYLDAMSEVIQSASTHDWKPDMVVFTAHSLPRHSVEEGDPYVFQLQQTARMLAQQLDLPRWIMSFQSAPQGGDIRRDAWLGPDILQTIDSLATDGVSRILVAPIGFISDHLEVLYDIDVQARRHADGLGVEMRRTESLNTHPKLIEALADAVLEAV